MTQGTRQPKRNVPRDALSVSDATRRDLMALAQRAISRRQIMLAEQVAQILREVAPDRPQWMEIGGLINQALGMESEAIKTFERCLEIHPRSTQSLRALMKLAALKSDWDQVVALSASRALDESCARFVVRACDELAGRNKAPRALDGLMSLVKIGTTDADVYIRASRLAIYVGDLPLNRRILEGLKAVRPHNAYGHLADYHEFMASGQVEAARDTLRELDATFPNNAALISNLCEIALELYNVEEAAGLLGRLEGHLPGRRIKEMRVRLAACSNDWSSVLSLSTGPDRHQTDVRSRALELHALIHLGRAEEALPLSVQYEEEAVRRGLHGRWFGTARQVANFHTKTKKFSTDRDYVFAYPEASGTAAPEVVRMLWVGGKLSPIEQLSIKSWLNHGFDVELYTYDGVGNVPKGCKIKDGEDVMPRSSIFAHSAKTGRSAGSFAGFADIFRWRLLEKLGGFWSDCDIVCLSPFKLPQGLTIASEVARTFNADHMAITNCFFGGPAGHPMFAEACSRIENFDPEALGWGELGTQLIGELVDQNDLEASVLPSTAFNAISPYRMISAMFSKDDGWFDRDMAGCWGLHLYNEVWRSRHVSKNGPFPRDSVIHRLFAEHDIKVEVTPHSPIRTLEAVSI